MTTYLLYGRETFVTEHVHAVFAHKCVCAHLCVHAIQISVWSPRKPEINRSQSVFRRLERQFCFKTSKHHLYSTFRAHKCLSDICERPSERERKRKREAGGGKKGERKRAGGNRSEQVYFWRWQKQHTKTDRQTESDGAGGISSVPLIG